MSTTPESSVELSPHDPREPITVSTISLDAEPTSDDPRPASSINATELAVINFSTVSFVVKLDSAEALGRYSLLPLRDLHRLLTITFITLIDSALETHRSDILLCAPSTILGMSAIKSSELSRLAAVTVVAAAVVMEEIWAAVRELESVLLVFLEETLVRLPQVSSRDLEVLDDERLALSSAITEDERLVVLEPEPEPELAVLVYSSSSLLEHDETSTAMLTKRINQDNKLFILFIFRKY